MTEELYGPGAVLRDRRRWAACFVVALALHTGVALALAVKGARISMADAAPAPVLIDLAPLVSSRAEEPGSVAERPPANDAEPRKSETIADKPIEEPPAEKADEARAENEAREGRDEQPEAKSNSALELALQPPDGEPLDLKLPAAKSEVEIPAQEPASRRAPDQAPQENVNEEVRREKPVAPRRKAAERNVDERKPFGKPPERKKQEPRKQVAAVPERAPDDPRKIGPHDATSTREDARRTAAVSAAGAQASAASALAAWQSRVRAHLERHKRYPADAGGERGVASIVFVLDRRGRVLSKQLLRSAGNAALDRETLDLIARAQPMPAPPAELTQPRFSFATSLNYGASR